MKPGRELDALVAEKVIGIAVKDWPTGKEFPVTSAVAAMVLSEAQMNRIPHYSNDLNAANSVIEHLKSKCGYSTRLEAYKGGCEFYAEVFTSSGSHVCNSNPSEAESLAHAICLAALKAVGYEFSQ